MPMIFIDEGKRVDTYSVDSLTEIYGVNTVEDLAFCEQELAKQNNKNRFPDGNLFFYAFYNKTVSVLPR